MSHKQHPGMATCSVSRSVQAVSSCQGLHKQELICVTQSSSCAPVCGPKLCPRPVHSCLTFAVLPAAVLACSLSAFAWASTNDQQQQVRCCLVLLALSVNAVSGSSFWQSASPATACQAILQQPIQQHSAGTNCCLQQRHQLLQASRRQRCTRTLHFFVLQRDRPSVACDRGCR
jgi:hypothetical protein